jgi:uncharacterized protein with von Willebrand factor type A (vWA) domain
MLQPSATSSKLHIPLPLMIANDPYLQKFVNKFTESNQGSFYTGLKGLGEMILRIMKPTKEE